MKVREKSTGDIIEVTPIMKYSVRLGEYYESVEDEAGRELNLKDVEIIESKDTSIPDRGEGAIYIDPSISYWDKLLHQYAGMAMQGILANIDLLMSLAKKKADDYPAKYTVAEFAKDCATALVEKLKGKQGMEPILDVCCGGKMFYFDKNDSRVLFQDIRDIETELCDGRHFEVKPDVIGDFTNMKFEDNSFSMVVFDPPHLKYTGSKKECDGWQMTKYGYLGKDWKDTLSKGFKECFRVLKPGGFLIFKWNETDIKVSEILKLTTAKPIFGHISGKRANTHWICFMKEE